VVHSIPWIIEDLPWFTGGLCVSHAKSGYLSKNGLISLNIRDWASEKNQRFFTGHKYAIPKGYGFIMSLKNFGVPWY
jgi:hypothetical protein